MFCRDHHLILLSPPSFFQDGLKAVENLKPSIETLSTDLHTVRAPPARPRPHGLDAAAALARVACPALSSLLGWAETGSAPPSTEPRAQPPGKASGVRGRGSRGRGGALCTPASGRTSVMPPPPPCFVSKDQTGPGRRAEAAGPAPGYPEVGTAGGAEGGEGFTCEGRLLGSVPRWLGDRGGRRPCLPGAHRPCWAVRAAATRSAGSPRAGSAARGDVCVSRGTGPEAAGRASARPE